MSGQRLFTLDYVEHAVLGDGTQVRLRLVRPEDKEAVREGFGRLSPASRYARFLATKLSLSDAELRYLCEVDHEDHFAIGASLDGPDGAPTVGLGLARFVRLPDRDDTAEAAITVVDDLQRRGLGKLLFLRLIAAARERGIRRFRCEVLASNAGMVALLAQIAPERTVEVSQGVMSIELVLPGDEPRDSSIYRLFRAAAQNAVDWTAAVRRLWRR
jgi:GNAT superfamily N-acetyltransferase